MIGKLNEYFPKGGKSCFTVVEILVAIALILFAFLAIAQMQIMTIMTNSTANKKTMAATLAQDQLEKLRALPYNQITSSSDTVGIYTRTWTVENNTPAQNMKRVTVTVSWQGKQVQLQSIIVPSNL